MDGDYDDGLVDQNGHYIKPTWVYLVIAQQHDEAPDIFVYPERRAAEQRAEALRNNYGTYWNVFVLTRSIERS